MVGLIPQFASIGRPIDRLDAQFHELRQRRREPDRHVGGGETVAGEAEQEVSSDSRMGEAGEEGKPTPQATKGDATGAATPRP